LQEKLNELEKQLSLEVERMEIENNEYGQK
jgi:hypothetical protein